MQYTVILKFPDTVVGVEDVYFFVNTQAHNAGAAATHARKFAAEQYDESDPGNIEPDDFAVVAALEGRHSNLWTDRGTEVWSLQHNVAELN